MACADELAHLLVRSRVDSEAVGRPLGKPVLQSRSGPTPPREQAYRVVGVYAERPTAVGDDVGAVRDLVQARLELVERDGDRSADVAGVVLRLRPNVHDDDVTVAQSPAELVPCDGAQPLPVAQ
jgi:hypothetical protein